MQVPDPEVRYGALCALRERDPREPSIRGIQMGDVTRVVQIPTKDTPMIAFSLSKYPEIAIFGEDPPLKIPTFIRINSRILLRPDPSGELRVSRFEPERRRSYSTGSYDAYRHDSWSGGSRSFLW
jgi:hypothetical protein